MFFYIKSSDKKHSEIYFGYRQNLWYLPPIIFYIFWGNGPLLTILCSRRNESREVDVIQRKRMSYKPNEVRTDFFQFQSMGSQRRGKKLLKKQKKNG